MKPTQQRTEEGEDFPNYVWVGFKKDDGEPQFVAPVRPADSAWPDLYWNLYFPADFCKKHYSASRVTALELELERAKEALRKITKAKKIEGLGWSFGTGSFISWANEPAAIARAALRDLGEGQ